jgi:hypothetical protein
MSMRAKVFVAGAYIFVVGASILARTSGAAVPPPAPGIQSRTFTRTYTITQTPTPTPSKTPTRTPTRTPTP